MLSCYSYIEPDLCLSSDGVFVAMHDVCLDDTTNVASVYPDRKATKTIDGADMTCYFVSDFTFAELKTLRLNQRLAGRSTLYNGLLEIPSLDEIMSLVNDNYASTGNMIGFYPELKHPSFFNSLGFPMADLLLGKLSQGGFAITGAPNNLTNVNPVVIQCFEPETLKYLKTKTDIALIQLLNFGDVVWNEEQLKALSLYATGLGPAKEYFGGSYGAAKVKVELAHSLGLALHPWTFRADQGILPQFENNFESEEMYFYCCLGIDGVFSEFPDRTRETIDLYKNHTALYKTGATKSQCTIQC
jgi:glycerophosphoryl diester phosphodiesterase